MFGFGKNKKSENITVTEMPSMLPENIKGVPVTSPFFNMMFTIAKAKKAVDWFNGQSLHSKLIGSSYRLHKHHIFPRDVLKKHGYYKEIEKKNAIAKNS